MKKMGEIIKEVIKESKYSVNDIAKKLGVTPQNLYRIFKKDSLETKYLEQLAEVLEIEIIDFFIKPYLRKENKDVESNWNNPDFWGKMTSDIIKAQERCYQFIEFMEVMDLEKIKPVIESVVGPVTTKEKIGLKYILKYLESLNDEDFVLKLYKYIDIEELNKDIGLKTLIINDLNRKNLKFE
jgi:transcriptional regulator with XRE-family HTH domain